MVNLRAMNQYPIRVFNRKNKLKNSFHKDIHQFLKQKKIPGTGNIIQIIQVHLIDYYLIYKTDKPGIFYC